MSNVDNTLQERGTRYGEFHDQAEYAQDMKAIFQRSPNWAKMTADQREGLEMIANKIGRILNGDPDYTDSWHDISGYAQLVEKRIEQRQKEEAQRKYNEKAIRYINSKGEEVVGYWDNYRKCLVKDPPSNDASPSVLPRVERGEVLGVPTLRPEGQVD